MIALNKNSKLFHHIVSDLQWINPQYHVQLKDPDVTDREFRCTIIVSLMEKETDKNKKIAVGFDIYKVGRSCRYYINSPVQYYLIISV